MKILYEYLVSDIEILQILNINNFNLISVVIKKSFWYINKSIVSIFEV